MNHKVSQPTGHARQARPPPCPVAKLRQELRETEKKIERLKIEQRKTQRQIGSLLGARYKRKSHLTPSAVKDIMRWQRETTEMPNSPPPNSGQLEVARIVWELKTATVSQVRDVFSKRREEGVSIKTIETHLRRLEKRGYLTSHREGKYSVYTPAGDQSPTVLGMYSFIQHFMRERLTHKEIEELREMLGRREPKK